MSNHLKFCGCRNCRDGMRRKRGSSTVRATIRKDRRITKESLKNDKEPINKISVPYCD